MCVFLDAFGKVGSCLPRCGWTGLCLGFWGGWEEASCGPSTTVAEKLPGTRLIDERHVLDLNYGAALMAIGVTLVDRVEEINGSTDNYSKEPSIFLQIYRAEWEGAERITKSSEE